MTSPLFVGIAGGSASGKSTFTRLLQQRLSAAAPQLQIASYSTDHYFHRDFTRIPTYTSPAFGAQLPDFNHPDGLDIPQLVADLHARTCGENPPDMILMEGHLLFYFAELRERFDVRIFIDLDGETRALRRMVRNLAHPGDPIPDHSPQSIASYYLESAREGYRTFIEPTKHYADLVINGDGDFQRTAGLVTAMLLNLRK